MISIVSPVYNAEKILPTLVERIQSVMQTIAQPYEIILVEDGGPDRSWQVMEELAAKHKTVKAIQLSRNFGQHNAITAGLHVAKGEWIVVMDCDLQDQPEEIPNLYRKALEGYDMVLARRAQRQDRWMKRMASKSFYAVFSYLTDTTQDSAVANFGIYHKRVIAGIQTMGDYYRVFPILVQWIGFKRFLLDVEHAPRHEGKSSYSTIKLLRLAFDMIISFSDKPMRLALKMGILISIFSILLSVYYLVWYMLGNIKVPGYTSLAVLISFSTGILLTFLGLVGTYVGKISQQVKHRPNFIIRQFLNE